MALHNWIRSPLLSRRGLGAYFCQTSLLPALSGFSSQDAREGPSYADLQALRVDDLGTGGTPSSPDTFPFLLSHSIPDGAATQ